MGKNNKLPLSVLILSKNEEGLIADCLKQFNFADEIILLDQQSSDNTVKIAREYTNKILLTLKDNFAKKRERLKKAAENEWILYFDVDERLSENSTAEITSAISGGENSAYYFSRKNIILGKWLKHGGWWPDYVPRLFKKSELIGWYGEVHESPKVKGSIGYFKSPIIHLTATDMSRMLGKTIKYASIEAKLQYQARHPKVNIPKVVYAPIREFTKRYFLKLGFLDGTVGLIEAIFQAYHTTVVLVYLWELQNHTQEKYSNEDV